MSTERILTREQREIYRTAIAQLARNAGMPVAVVELKLAMFFEDLQERIREAAAADARSFVEEFGVVDDLDLAMELIGGWGDGGWEDLELDLARPNLLTPEGMIAAEVKYRRALAAEIARLSGRDITG